MMDIKVMHSARSVKGGGGWITSERIGGFCAVEWVEQRSVSALGPYHLSTTSHRLILLYEGWGACIDFAKKRESHSIPKKFQVIPKLAVSSSAETMGSPKQLDLGSCNSNKTYVKIIHQDQLCYFTWPPLEPWEHRERFLSSIASTRSPLSRSVLCAN